MNEAWNLLRLNPQNQTKYVDHVAEYVPEVEVYFPVFTKLVRPNGVRHPIQQTLPVYPGYVFARIDQEDSRCFHAMVSSPVRAWFIRFGGEIALVPDKVVTELRRLESLRMLVREQVRHNPYSPGRNVVVHTPAADIVATIVRIMGGNRALVDTPLGRATVRLHTLSLR